VAYGPQSLLLPIFRGPRVRIGIHTGTATSVSINPVTKRLVYAGEVASIAKAVSDAPCGGQIVMSGETLAEVRSMQDLSKRVCRLPVHLPPNNERASWASIIAASQETNATPACVFLMSRVLLCRWR
jgi:class 3 adenylate cyclase